MKTVFCQGGAVTSPTTTETLATESASHVHLSDHVEILRLLPSPIWAALEAHVRGGGGAVEEIRLRAGRCASLTVGGRNILTPVILSTGELRELLDRMCGGSPYAYSETIHQGYVTLPGGVRVGVAGLAACEGGRVIGVKTIHALNIRLPSRRRAVGKEIVDLLRRTVRETGHVGGILIYAPPGVGKTTLLRGIAASLAGGHEPWRTVIVDTRGELGFNCEGAELCLDVLSGYPRALGIEIATRTMGAQVILCDEIGDASEAAAMEAAHHGGVPLVATAHAGDLAELLCRTGIRRLHEARLFSVYVGIRRDGRGGFLYDVTQWEQAAKLLSALP